MRIISNLRSKLKNIELRTPERLLKSLLYVTKKKYVHFTNTVLKINLHMQKTYLIDDVQRASIPHRR